MIKINKTDDPLFHVDFKKKTTPKNWDDYSDKNIKDVRQKGIKVKLKAHMIEQEQDGYCPYCERKIAINNSHIEHIEPKHLASKFKDYDNLLASCNYPETCGAAKKGKFSPNFLNPVACQPMEILTYDLDTGEIQPLEEDARTITFKQANETIETLQLNEPNLLNTRKKFLVEIGQTVQCMDTDDVENYLTYLIDDKQPFKMMLKQQLLENHELIN